MRSPASTKGQQYARMFHHREWLVKTKRASWYMPYRNMNDAVAKAGL